MAATKGRARPRADSTKSSKALGIALGTLIGGIAAANPQSAICRTLGLFAGVVAVIADGLWTEAARELRAWTATREHNAVKDTIGHFLQNPLTSEEHKATLRQQMEAIELKSLDSLPRFFNPPLNTGGEANTRNSALIQDAPSKGHKS
jgi:hypothetical protein